MKKIFSQIKARFGGGSKSLEDEYKADEEKTPDYLELDTEGQEGGGQKAVVRSFVIEDFSDIKVIIDAMREGKTIGLINVRPLREKDMIELKRTVNKLKKTIDALEGDIAGFGEDWIVVTPSFAQIYRNKDTKKIEEEKEEVKARR